VPTWIPQGWHTVTPRLVARDPGVLIAFLKHAFAASAEIVEGGPTLVSIGDSIVMVSGAGPREPMPAFFHLYVEDTDATFRRALEAGATCVEEPAEMLYGDRRAMVKDPWGNDWQIATPKMAP
jgi:PhnB protein